MEHPPTNQSKPNEVCTITVAFPVGSDDEAIDVKKKIGDLVKDIPDARVDFRIMSLGKPRERV